METEKLKHELRDTLESLRTLRDEIRVQVHLGGMDAKQRWQELEGEFNRVQAAAKVASDTSLSAVRKAFQEFRATLKAS